MYEMRICHRTQTSGFKITFKLYARSYVCPQNAHLGGFKRLKRVCGTSGRSVNIDFLLLRIFLRLEALIKNIFQGGAR